MSVLQTYLAAKLAEDGYSGLAGNDCGCELDDLGPCGCPGLLCGPGYRHNCGRCPRRIEDNCPMEDGGLGYCVSKSKDWPEAEA